MTTQLAGLNDRLVKFKSDKNEAAAGKYILDTYTPKPLDDTTCIATLIDYLDTLMQSADELDKMLKCHDGALFLKDSQKLKSGRKCHHLFNEMTITKVIDFKANCLETKSKLEEAKNVQMTFSRINLFCHLKERIKKIMTTSGKLRSEN